MKTLACLALALTLGATSQEKIKVLIVDGQNNHDWEGTTPVLKKILLKAGKFEVDVATTPPRKSAKEAWEAFKPDFSKYKVVLSNYNGDAWPAPVREAFEKFIHDGGGAVMVHAANNAFADWEAFNKMIGLGWRNEKYGDRITIKDETGEQVRTPKGTGKGAGHGAQHEFVVTVRKTDHPITRGIPIKWKHAKDELYHGQRGPASDMTVLLSAYDDPAVKGTGEHEPILWTIPFGKGQVVTNVLGHYMKGKNGSDPAEMVALNCVGFQALLTRSCEWAATGAVTIPVPADFPSAEKISLSQP